MIKTKRKKTKDGTPTDFLKSFITEELPFRTRRK